MLLLRPHPFCLSAALVLAVSCCNGWHHHGHQAAAARTRTTILTGKFVNGGSPPGVLPASDCALRNVTHAFGASLAPRKGRYSELHDALQLSKCGVPSPPPAKPWSPPSFGEQGALIFVDPAAGDDNQGTGSKRAPFK